MRFLIFLAGSQEQDEEFHSLEAAKEHMRSHRKTGLVVIRYRDTIDDDGGGHYDINEGGVSLIWYHEGA